MKPTMNPSRRYAALSKLVAAFVNRWKPTKHWPETSLKEELEREFMADITLVVRSARLKGRQEARQRRAKVRTVAT